MAGDKKQGAGKAALMPSPSGEFGQSALTSTNNQPIVLHYREQIKRHGANPYYAVRSALGVESSDIAAQFTMDKDEYVTYEKSAVNVKFRDIEFVFGFCRTLKISPMDLLPQSGVPSFALYGAMVETIENPHLVGLCEDVDETHLVELHDFVHRLALPENSVKVLKKRSDAKRRDANQEYVRELCNHLLTLDRSIRLKSLDMVEDVIEDFISDKKSAQKSLANMIANQQAVVDDIAKDVHALGWKLFPISNDADTQWKSVWSAIDNARLNLCKNDIKKTVEMYCLPDARIIGREKWPCFHSTTVDYNGQTYDWTTARHMHAEKIAVYYTEFIQCNLMKYQWNQGEKRITMLEISDGVLDGAIRNFQYRQIAMHSMAVRQVIDEDVRMERVNSRVSSDSLLPSNLQQLLMK